MFVTKFILKQIVAKSPLVMTLLIKMKTMLLS